LGVSLIMIGPSLQIFNSAAIYSSRLCTLSWYASTVISILH